jgi:hypothetical protein
VGRVTASLISNQQFTFMEGDYTVPIFESLNLHTCPCLARRADLASSPAARFDRLVVIRPLPCANPAIFQYEPNIGLEHVASAATWAPRLDVGGHWLLA